MILGIGTDIVKVDRFVLWRKYSTTQLGRVFSKNELKECLIDNTLNIQRMAVRFAAKEAFYKALSKLLIKFNFTKQSFSFLFCCRYCEVKKMIWGVPVLQIDWEAFEKKIGETLPKINVELSLSHEERYAVAFVILMG
jgi:phosphopantetheine--protein transferase-like protein